MENYVLMTDSACDIRPALLEKWGVPSLDMTFRFDGEAVDYTERDIDFATFYNKMREGGVAKTAAINPETFRNGFENILKQGKDILYLAFSSGLSTTANSARLAAEELRERYPDRKLVIVDTLAASAGQGLLVYLTLQKKNEGASLEEAALYAESNKLNLCHWFTVDDLVYLKRGGRVSSAAAFVGTVLSIKPVLHVDDEGHLINISKVRGRKAALKALIQKYEELAEDKGGTVFISNADCIEDAESVKRYLTETHSANVELITEIGPVIGAHSGPGTLAIFFLGKNR